MSICRIDSDTSTRGLKLKIDELWKRYYEYEHATAEIKDHNNNPELKELESERKRVCDKIYDKSNLQQNPILLTLDQHFNDSYDLSNLVWSYVPSDTFYCHFHQEMIYSENCPKCVYDSKKKWGEYHLHGALELKIGDFYSIRPTNELDKQMFKLIFRDCDNGWYHTNLSFAHKVYETQNVPHFNHPQKLIYFFYYCSDNCVNCEDYGHYQCAVESLNVTVDEFIEYFYTQHQ